MWSWQSFFDLRDNFDLKIFCEFWSFFLKYWKHTFKDIIEKKKFPTISKTVLSDFHKMGLTVLRTSTIKLPPNIISYSSCKYFNKNKLLHELDQELRYGDFYMTEDTYSKVTEIDFMKH